MRKVSFHSTIFGILLVVLIPVRNLRAQNLDSLFQHSLEFARQQLENSVAEIVDTTQFARSTDEYGNWTTKSSGSWTSGFFPGCLWHMYKYTSDSTWKNWARSWTAGLWDEQYDTGTHDVGFKVFDSYGLGYRMTINEDYKPVILRAAQSLATRYNSTVGCTRSWNNRTFPVIIDNMMNLELLFWASKNGGETEWYDMAISHGLRTMQDHVRADGSTYQIVDYNPTTGIIIQKETSQGYTTESTWARGQSWGLYGFTMAYRHTGDVRLLETACKLADFVVDNLPEDYVPYWDYFAPNIPNEEKDASAAAIAASGLLELSGLVDSTDLQVKYWNTAENILASLSSDSYLAESSNSSGILLHGVGNHNKGSEVDVSLIYADYYFIEALLRHQGLVSPTLAPREYACLTPTKIKLLPNYPNPFNPVTTIPYRLSESANLAFSVYDLTGRRIRSFDTVYQNAGNHRFIFNARQLASGIYLFVMQAGPQVKSIKITLVR
ncbi:MAG: glycoside hydrolase family 88 protein [Fidelibacterota bacterium]|nr:MAG: glycoside hydrolase family 88 protein [Candidatus Neomarinimicrobiota bacterium]